MKLYLNYFKKYGEIILLLFIFIIFSYFRFNNLDKRIGFNWDQEQYSFQIKQLLVDHKPILLGQRVNNDQGFFLAPYFTYLIAPFFIITNLHPMALLYFLIFFNIIFFLITYLILKQVFNKKTSYVFLAFWATNPILTKYDTIAWPPILIPLGVITTIWLLYKTYTSNKNLFKWYLLLGLTLGLFLSMHFQFIIVIFFACVFLLSLIPVKKIHISNVLIMIFSFLLTFLPLLIFDIRHNFLNLNLLLNFFVSKDTTLLKPDYISMIAVFNNLTKPLIIFGSTNLTIFFFIFILACMILLYLKNKKFYKNLYLSFIAVWLLFPVLFALYKNHPSEYYLIFLYPFIYLAVINSLTIFPKKISGVTIIILLSLLFVTNIKSLNINTNGDVNSFYYKDNLIKQMAPYVKDKKFNIGFSVLLGSDTGYKYLFDYYKIKQSGNWKDTTIQLKVPVAEDCQIKSGNMCIYFPPEFYTK